MFHKSKLALALGCCFASESVVLAKEHSTVDCKGNFELGKGATVDITVEPQDEDTDMHKATVDVQFGAEKQNSTRHVELTGLRCVSYIGPETKEGTGQYVYLNCAPSDESLKKQKVYVLTKGEGPALLNDGANTRTATGTIACAAPKAP